MQLENLIEQIETRPKADAIEAARVVGLMVKSYPPRMTANAPEPSREYLAQLTTLCTGVEIALLQLMVNPREGILATHKFLPSVAEVVAWLDGHMQHTTKMLTTYRHELEQITTPMPPIPDAAERARRMKVLTEVKEKIKPKTLEWLKPEEEQSAKERAEAARLRKTQVHDPEALLQALANLESQRMTAEGDDE